MSDITVIPKLMALDLVGVADPGIPNQERVYLRATLDVRLGEYLLHSGWRVGPDIAYPLRDHLLWLGPLTAQAGTWVVVYTGPGEQRVTRMDNGDPALVLHWGKQIPIFAHPQIIPVLVHMGGISVGRQLK